MKPRRLLALAAVVVLLGVVTAALTVMTVAALPAVLAIGLTVLALVGASVRSRHRAWRHDDPVPAAVQVDHASPGGPGVPSRLQWTLQWDAEPPVYALHDARERTAAALADWGLTGEAVEPALLVVTELLSNAVEHGGGPRWLSLDLAGGSVRIEVRDDAPEPPQLRPPDPLRARGRGLHLVEALSSRWGWTADPPGKVAWADVPTRWPT